MPDSQLLPTLVRYLPPAAVAYAYALWQAHPFTLRVARPRQTRLGDYCYSSQRGHAVSVNGNLTPSAFLITYLHEVAHRVVYERHNRRVAPHGAVWKKQFRELLQPVLREDVFPEPVLLPLREYARNPGATTATCPPLMRALHQLDTTTPQGIPLAEIGDGDRFELNGRQFVRGPLRRTRYLCTESSSGRRYTVLASALVRKA
jgi:hypothetical protein